jgi:hypothetical protein
VSIRGTSSSGVSGFLEELADGREMTLGEIVRRLKETYCSTIGVVRAPGRYFQRPLHWSRLPY